jgi:hypothetical protein
VLDDHRFTADPRIQESGHIWDYFANYVWAQFIGGAPSFYRPIFILWVRMNFIVNALSPWGWHLFSIAKHASVSALLGLLVWKLVRDPLAALAASTLFALHPAQTESVAWVTVPDPLMSAGVLGALLLYLKYLEDVSTASRVPGRKARKTSSAKAPGRSAKWLILSAAVYFAALLAKETAIIFPVIVLALSLFTDRSQPDRGRSAPAGSDANFAARFGPAFRQVAPFVGVTLIYLLLRLHALGGKLGAATQHLPWTMIIFSWPACLWFYMKVLFWPVRSSAFADPVLVDTFSLRAVLLPAFALACMAAALAATLWWASRKAGRELLRQEASRIQFALISGTLLLVLPLLLTLNLNALNPGDFLHGRYTYLPLAGLMLLAATVWRLANKRYLFVSGAVAIAMVFGVLTVSQEKQWRDDATVFTIAHELAPHNGPVAQNLANTRVQAALRMNDEGRCTEAVPVFDAVIRDYPQDWYAWAGLGYCFVQLNDLARAEESLHRAADISHDSRIVQQWRELRAHMGLPDVSSPN